ncbi:HAD hydrolase-like protein [Salinisphaera sp. SPP-AMP-43]|uniref:HAD hydrolase-like protein n=1 Tax=Salinisphaera sp. SPP-AMP-43 TaxID=3121288 RepID=UPI003C6DE4DF
MSQALSVAHGWPRAIIFDLDGTLIDSAPDIAAAVNRALAEFEFEITAEDARRYLGNGARKLIARVAEAHGHTLDDQRLTELTERFGVCYREQPCVDSQLYPGTEAALARLKADGMLLAICTNKPKPIADQVVAHMGLDRYIDAVVGAGQYALKPDPAPLQACLRQLVCQSGEALYIGDMAVDRQAGHAAGLAVLIADFGYSATPAAELGADGVLTDWSKLEPTIAGLLDRH